MGVGDGLLGAAAPFGLCGAVAGRTLEGERGGGGEEGCVVFDGWLMVHWLTLGGYRSCDHHVTRIWIM